MAEQAQVVPNGRQESIFAPFVQAQTYLNILYLLLAFPLGLFYFVFLITGLSVGISLVIVWVGILVLLVVFAAWWGLSAFERQLAIRLLGANIPPMTRQTEPVEGIWPRFKAYLSNPVTWKGLAYLFAKFPLGLLSFVLVVTLVPLSLGLLAAPFVYPFIEVTGGVMMTFSEALLVGIIGFGLTVLSVHIFNWLAYASGWFAAVMLGDQKAAEGDTPIGPQAMARPTFRMGAQTQIVAGAVLLGLGALALVSQFFDMLGRYVWPLALVALGIVLIATRARATIAGDAKAEGEEPAAAERGAASEAKETDDE
jgi:hypothetical protein